MLILGLDAASQFENFGYALGSLDGDRVQVRQFGLLRTKDAPDALQDVLAPELGRAERALVAVDAPLGWPVPLGSELGRHLAGQPVHADKAIVFCRETDRFVHQLVGKKPLEVGADKIARAAYSALAVLNELRQLSAALLPLAWDPSFEGKAAIEVYPGATLKARGLPHSGYSKDDARCRAARETIAHSLAEEIPDLATLLDEPAHVFDACLCLVAAKDFLDGAAVRPPDDMRALSQQEGWIWVRNPQR
jgi:predicted RNase H-like nuclease